MVRKKVLIVDDDALIRELVSQYLAYGGYEAFTAADGESALACYAAERPDLVVLDVAMPGMSGLDVADELRRMQAEYQWPLTPIVLLTAYARSFIIPTGYDQRVNSVMRKPINRDEFLQHISRFLLDSANSSS